MNKIAETENPHVHSGFFTLYPLLDFVAQNPSLPPFLAKTDRRGGADFSKKIRSLLEQAKVPADQGGWYLWGKFNDAAWWETIYVGKTGKGKTSSLHTRLFDELREEGTAALYASVYGWDAVVIALRKRAKKHQTDGGKDWFGTGGTTQRGLRKRDTTFIIWVTAPEGLSDTDIREIERGLIHLYRPAFNSIRSGKGIIHESVHPLMKDLDEMIQEQIRRMTGQFSI